MEDRVEELEREQEINEKKLSEMEDLKKLVNSKLLLDLVLVLESGTP